MQAMTSVSRVWSILTADWHWVNQLSSLDVLDSAIFSLGVYHKQTLRTRTTSRSYPPINTKAVSTQLTGYVIPHLCGEPPISHLAQTPPPGDHPSNPARISSASARRPPRGKQKALFPAERASPCCQLAAGGVRQVATRRRGAPDDPRRD